MESSRVETTFGVNTYTLPPGDGVPELNMGLRYVPGGVRFCCAICLWCLLPRCLGGYDYNGTLL